MLRKLLTRFCRWYLNPKRLHRCLSWSSVYPIRMTGQMVLSVSEIRERTHYFCRWCGSKQCINAERKPAEAVAGSTSPAPPPRRSQSIIFSREELEQLRHGPIVLTQDMLPKLRYREGGTIG